VRDIKKEKEKEKRGKTRRKKERKEFNVDNRVTSMAGFYGVEAAHTSDPL